LWDGNNDTLQHFGKSNFLAITLEVDANLSVPDIFPMVFHLSCPFPGQFIRPPDKKQAFYNKKFGVFWFLGYISPISREWRAPATAKKVR
jgi:hypothetical protein